MRILAGSKRPSLSLIELPAGDWKEETADLVSSEKLDSSVSNNNNRREDATSSAQASKSKMMTQPKIYHEKQVKALCALHALNNLFQDQNAFTQKELDAICSELSPNSWLNPHKSLFNLGNYDINVIMTALQHKQYEAIWFDKRKDPSCLDFDKIFGFILNIPTDCRVGWVSLPLKRKHWFSLKRFQDNFYNLDSKNDSPMVIGNENEVISYLREELKCREKELFIVVEQQVSNTQSWLRNPAASTGSLGNAADTALDSSVITRNGLLPSAISGRKDSADSGVVELLDRDLELNIVDLDKEDDENRFT